MRTQLAEHAQRNTQHRHGHTAQARTTRSAGLTHSFMSLRSDRNTVVQARFQNKVALQKSQVSFHFRFFVVRTRYSKVHSSQNAIFMAAVNRLQAVSRTIVGARLPPDVCGSSFPLVFLPLLVCKTSTLGMPTVLLLRCAGDQACGLVCGESGNRSRRNY